MTTSDHAARPAGSAVRFAEHTTARVGGPAGEWITAKTEQRALEALARHPLPAEQDRAMGEDSLLVLGGGSNLLISDSGFSGTVLHLSFSGIAAEPASDGDASVVVTAEAGHSWDDVVAWTVVRGYAGLEALSGIPGSVGATPVQNVGAYGTDVSQTLLDARVWDRDAGEILTLTNEQLEFGYRDSLLKRSTLAGSPRYVVLSVRFRLVAVGTSGPSAPIRYAELARGLGLEGGAAMDAHRAPLEDVRDKVLALRAGKGMVLDPTDHDTWSTGSFFTNPVVSASRETVRGLPQDAPRFPVGTAEDGGELVKLSAAWLIDRAGCEKGFGAELTGGRASLSTKHTLAVTNRGGASAEDMLSVARAVRVKVKDRFGIELHPEPVLLGCSL